MLSMVYAYACAVAWLCLLSHSALAKIVDDNSPSITYIGDWTQENNNDYYSGGTAHHTNTSGATANYIFTGVAVTLYGLLQRDGAAFSLTIDNSLSWNCTSRQNGTNTWSFGSELCSAGGLNGTVQHTLMIQHADPSGGWLTIDYLDVALVGPTSVITSAASPTKAPTAPTHFGKYRSKVTVKIQYGIAGLAIGFVVGALIVSFMCQCCRRKPSFTITAN